MAVKNAIIIGGKIVTDADSCDVTAASGDLDSTAHFSAMIPNYNGQHKTDFNVGDVVEIYADDNTNPLEDMFTFTFPMTFSNPTKIFLGVVDSIQFQGEEYDEKIMISGRDYTSRLQDITIEPNTFSNTEVSVIITNLIAAEVPEITVNHVMTTTKTVTNIRYNHLSVYDAIKNLAEYVDYVFYVDVYKDLHFEPKGTTVSGITLDNTNILTAQFENTKSQMANSIWIYGDRQLSGVPQEAFISNGVGSVYTLQYKPHNTVVKVSGTQYKGGIFQMFSTPTSGVQYLVDYDNKNIILASGTVAGDNRAGSLVQITVDYQRDIPLIRLGENQQSILLYGKKEKVIVDKNIKDPRMATDMLKAELSEHGLPVIQGELTLQGIDFLQPSSTVIVNLANQNIVNQVYTILETRYSFNPQNNESGEVLSVTVSQKISTLMDTLKQMQLDINKLKSADIDTGTNASRLLTATGSAHARVSYWQIATRPIYAPFILGSPGWGELGSNITAPQTYLGEAGSGNFVIQASGGEA